MRNPSEITRDLTAYSEFYARIGRVDDKVRSRIMNGEVTVRDHTLYSCTKVGNSVQTELTATFNGKSVGLTNFDRRRLDASNYMCVTHIRLLAGTAPNLHECSYSVLQGSALNGELEIKLGQNVVIKSLSLAEFNNSGIDESLGMYRLESPLMIGPEVEVVPTLKLSAPQNENYCVRIELHGVITSLG